MIVLFFYFFLINVPKSLILLSLVLWLGYLAYKQDLRCSPSYVSTGQKEGKECRSAFYHPLKTVQNNYCGPKVGKLWKAGYI